MPPHRSPESREVHGPAAQGFIDRSATEIRNQIQDDPGPAGDPDAARQLPDGRFHDLILGESEAWPPTRVDSGRGDFVGAQLGPPVQTGGDGAG